MLNTFERNIEIFYTQPFILPKSAHLSSNTRKLKNGHLHQHYTTASSSSTIFLCHL